MKNKYSPIWRKPIKKPSAYEKYLVLWTAILALSTFFLFCITIIAAFIGYRQLTELSKTSNADFVIKFRQNFYKDDNTRTLEMLLKQNLLILDTTNIIPYFKVNKIIIDSLKQNKESFNNFKDILQKEKIDSIETYKISYLFIDNKLLAHFEEMGYYVKKDIISIDFIYEYFDWDIKNVWENKEIKKFIAYSKSSPVTGNEEYVNFGYLYNEVKKYDSLMTNSSKIKKEN